MIQIKLRNLPGAIVAQDKPGEPAVMIPTRYMTEYAVVGADIGGIDARIRGKNQTLLRGADEEFALARRFRREDGLESAQTLVNSHLRLIAVACGHVGYGISAERIRQIEAKAFKQTRATLAPSDHDHRA